MPYNFIFISNYTYGGTITFTSHLLHTLGIKSIFTIDGTFENKLNGNFGYGLRYKSIPIEYLHNLKDLFITDMYKNFHLLNKLKRRDIMVVIHDPGEIFKENFSYLKYWNIITVRKTVQNFLRRTYGVDSLFLYHPFFPYRLRENKKILKQGAISISRVDYNKYIDIMLEANKIIKNPIDIYGFANPIYVKKVLNGLNFEKYYQGTFRKSFVKLSSLLKKAKFMIDLSVIPNGNKTEVMLNDGGGTQYTYLEAIYNDSAIILNRRWIEGVEKKYRDFKEGENCYAVSNAQELAEILNSDKDTTKIIQAAKKIMKRHIKSDWSKILK